MLYNQINSDMIPEWAKEMNCAVTVCDKEGVIVYMNDKAKETFASHGNLVEISMVIPEDMPHYVR